MKKGISLVLTILSTICFSVNAFAQDWKCNSLFDYKTGTVLFNGTAENGSVSVVIPDKETSIEGLRENVGAAEQKIVYNNEVKTEKDGSFSITAELGDSLAEGEYTAYFGQKGSDGAKEISFYYMRYDEYKEKIDELNSLAAASENVSDEFRTFIRDNAVKIGFNNPFEQRITDYDSVLSDLFHYAKNIRFSNDSPIVNTKIYKSAVIAEAFNEGKISASDEWISDINLAKNTIEEDYKKYAVDNSVLNSIIKRLSNKKININNIEDEVFSALVLSVVEKPNGIGNIKDVFEKYKTLLKGTNGTTVNTANATEKNYSDLVGSYNTIVECIDKFNSLVSKNDKSSGNNSGGSSSGGGKSDGISNATVNGGQAISIKDEIPIKFMDLNSVPWAYTAISNLFTRNIINGKSETEFSPDDDILREEFIKLIVCLFELENSEYTHNNFSDVSESQWYEKYVNIAYDNGICKGIGDGMFGVGVGITREDMCVIIYNALKNSYTLDNGEKKFADDTDISQYATEAVSKLGASGIVNGMGDNQFMPQNHATRAEASVLIFNVLNYMNK